MVRPGPCTARRSARTTTTAWRTPRVVLGLRVPDLLVENVVTTVKTYPNFAPVWERLMTSD